MYKSAAIFALSLIPNLALAQENPSVLEEALSSWEFATVYSCAEKEGNATGNIPSAIATPLIFKFSPTSNSVAVSMLNAEVKKWASNYTKNEALQNLAPVVANCAGALSAHFFEISDAAKLFGKKAAYGLADVALSITGHNVTAGVSMLALAHVAHQNDYTSFAVLACENAGLLLSDAVFALVQNAEKRVALASAVLIGLMNPNAIHLKQRAVVAVASGVALSSSLILLKSLLA